MKTKTIVEIKRSTGTITLGDLMVGDKFMFSRPFDYDSVFVVSSFECGGYTVKYTNINSGRSSYLPIQTKVIPVNVEIIATEVITEV